MSRQGIAIVVVLAGLLAASVVAWSSCRGNSTPRSAGRSGAASGGTGRIEATPVARGSIEGVVADPAGAVVAGARVCGTPRSDQLSIELTREPRCTTAGVDGRYRLDRLPPASYEVHAHAPRFAPGRYLGQRVDGRDRPRFALAAGEARRGIDITLGAGGVEVTGWVRDIGGGPVGGAWIRLESDQGASGRSGSASVQSEADGSFRAWSAPGRIQAIAGADGYASGTSQAIAPGHTLEILLTPESVLAGRVIDAVDGAPVVGARVHLGTSGSDAFDSGGVLTDQAGEFRFTRLPPDRYKPGASAPGRRGQAAQSVLLGLGQTVEGVVIEMHPASIVTGKVVLEDGKTPCLAGSVSLRDDRIPARAHATIDEADEHADGRVGFHALLPGSYQVEVRCQGHRAEPAYPAVEVVAGGNPAAQVWTVKAGARLRGRVLGHDGRPIAGAHVMARPKASGDGWSSVTSGSTEDDGSFVLDGLAGGTYHVTASRAGEPNNPEPVEVAVPERGEATVEVRLPQGGAVAGVVRDEDGAPVARVYVTVRSNAPIRSGNDRTLTLDDGSFRLDGLPPGPIRITAARDPFGISAMRAPGKTDDSLAGTKIDVEAGQTTRVELEVESRSGVIRGRVVDGDGVAITDAFVDAEREPDSARAARGDAARAMRWDWSRRPSLTDTDGGFAIEQLSRGTYTVRAYRRGGGEALAEHVAIGGTVTVTIRTTGSIAGSVISSGGAPERIKVTVSDRATGFARGEDFFRTAGGFVMRDLPAGSYEIAVSSGDATGQATAVLANGEELRGVSITMVGRAGVTGRLVAADTGKPLVGYFITASPAGARGMGAPGGSPPMTDDEGRFTVPNAPSGRVQVMASTIGMDSPYGFARTLVTLEAGKTFDLGELQAFRQRVEPGEDAGDLGFELRRAGPTDAQSTQLVVATVRDDAAAGKAGLVVGDEIVSVDGTDVRDDAYRFWSLARVLPGTRLVLGLARGATVTITAAPPRP